MSSPPVVLLGPQRHETTVGDVLNRVAPTGRLVTVTAGWQEREAEDVELNDLVEGRALNLTLYTRAEAVWRRDAALRAAHQAQQDRLRLLRQAYMTRLAHLIEAWRDVEALTGDPAVLDPERQAALDAVRELDAQHLQRVAAVRGEFDAALELRARPAVRQQREEIARLVEGASAVAIAGGHIAVLLNRLRMFDVGPLIAGLPVVAWSAGAMAIAERVVLFHDTPPQGAGHAEAFDAGLGFARDIVPLPHAGTRLRLDDPTRVGSLARRFAPARCVTLDPGEGVEFLEGRWVPLGGSHHVRASRRLAPDGSLHGLAA